MGLLSAPKEHGLVSGWIDDGLLDVSYWLQSRNGIRRLTFGSTRTTGSWLGAAYSAGLATSAFPLNVGGK